MLKMILQGKNGIPIANNDLKWKFDTYLKILFGSGEY